MELLQSAFPPLNPPKSTTHILPCSYIQWFSNLKDLKVVFDLIHPAPHIWVHTDVGQLQQQLPLANLRHPSLLDSELLPRDTATRVRAEQTLEVLSLLHFYLILLLRRAEVSQRTVGWLAFQIYFFMYIYNLVSYLIYAYYFYFRFY